MVLDTKTKACRPSKRGSRTSALWFNRPGANSNAKLMGSSEWALAGARAKSNPCKYGPKIDKGGKARCPSSILEANPAFKARYCKSGKYDLQIGKLPAYIVNPNPSGQRPPVCVRNPDTKASKRSVMSGTAMSTRGFKIVNGQVVHVGLKKNDLVKNPSGRIVSKQRRAHGQKIWKSQSKETRAKFLDQQARIEKGEMKRGPVKGDSIAAMTRKCKKDGLVINKRTKQCRESKRSGGPTIKELAAECREEGKVLDKTTRQCRDRKKAKKSVGPRKPRAIKGDSIAAMRLKCKEDGKVLNKATKRCRDKKKAAPKPRRSARVAKADLAALRLKCKEDGNQIYNQKTKQCRPRRKSSGRKAAPKPRRSARIASRK